MFIPLVSPSSSGNGNDLLPLVGLTMSSGSNTFKVESVVPEEGSTDVKINTAVQIEFSEVPIDFSTEDEYLLVKVDDIIIDGSFNKKNRFITFIPSNNLLKNSTHEIVVSPALIDKSGKSIENEFRSKFITQDIPDIIAPTITSVLPNINATNVSLNSPISINFSESVLSSSIDSNAVSVSINGSAIAGSTTLSGQSTILFIPNTNWPSYALVSVTVNTSVKDLSSNPLASAYNFTFRTVDVGTVSIFAGSDIGVSGNVSGTGTAARFQNPSYLTADNTGNIYVTDTNNCSVKKITNAGVVSFFAGSNAGLCGYVNNASGLLSRFNFPQGIAINPANTQLFLTDKFTHTIRRILTTTTFTVSTNNGNNASANTNGSGTTSRFSYPEGISIDSSGIIYVSDTNNCSIRKISGTTASTLAGTAPASIGVCGYVNATGATARFQLPKGVAVDASGNVFVADSGNCAIRKVTAAGVTTTLAGPLIAGNCGYADGTGTDARFNNPQGIVIDPMGNLYVTDTGNCAIRKITSAGVVSTFSGSAPPNVICGNVNSTLLASRFNNPKGITRDASGNLYITDTLNHSIKLIVP
ncbi:MAG: Ig-like domain-containing protein [Leptospira sp.]|nr:Ig-like domain-containing protein [Leptospira sp.]